ncbi:MAG: dicarboxylate/amino acid:cation symporter [Chitinophagaceae bacterium]|nr:dicarboxylate/amino acid:cation symporter [Chitinophagaceae bacterium]MCW5927585.1 dicarboxylate/amino acid:cation symporter [Chitinophagaceae bacterium]
MEQQSVVLHPIKELYTYLQSLVQKRLWLKVLIALVAGVALGAYFATQPGWISDRLLEAIINWISFPGNIFIRVVQMIMIPLMFSSVVQGIAGSNNKEYLMKSGPKLLIYYGLTTTTVLVLAVILVSVVKPGAYMDASNLIAADMAINTPISNGPRLSFGDIPRMITELLPANPLEALVSGDMLSIVIFAIITGVSLANIPSDTALPLLKVLYSVQEIAMAITRWAMKLAPVAIFGLMCQVTSKVGIDTILGLSMFMVTVVLGLIIVVIVYTGILLFIAKANIRKFFLDARDTLLLAFSVASSAAVMPLTLKTAEEKMGINPSVSRFIIPVGVSLNMDGTAVFQAIATLFLAQVYGLQLDTATILVVIVTTILASIGTPSAPGAGVIVLGSVLGTIGIPVTAIALIIGVDRLLGMFRTSVNVMGDLVTCQVFNRFYNDGHGRLESETASPGA